MFDLSPEHLRFAVVQMVVLILSIAVHEFGHAFVADRLGDSLPRHQGRVTLNPIAHIDPIGTLAMPLLGILIMGGIGFGWGKPVMVNPLSFTRKLRMKTAHLLVAAAGPFMNLVFGVFLAGVTAILVSAGVINPIDHTALLYGVYNAILLNFVLMFFNLVPAPPLDGGTVLAGLLPDRARPAYEQYAQYGMFVAMAVIMIPKLSLIFRWPAEQLFFKVVGPLMSLPGFS
jgi:Zn-dependent protease